MPVRVFPILEQNIYYNGIEGLDIKDTSLSIGNNSQVSHDGAIALGADSISKRENELSINVNPAGSYYQKCRMVIANFWEVTDSTNQTKEMLLRAGEFTISASSCVSFTLLVNAISDSGMAKSWECKGMILKDPASLTLMPNPVQINTIGWTAGTSLWDISLSASSSGNDRLIITATGDALEDTRFHAVLIGSEIIL